MAAREEEEEQQAALQDGVPASRDRSEQDCKGEPCAHGCIAWPWRPWSVDEVEVRFRPIKYVLWPKNMLSYRRSGLSR